MSLPSEIPPQSAAFGEVRGDKIYVDLGWYLFLYNIAINTLPQNGGFPASQADHIDMVDLDAAGSDVPQAYKEIVNAIQLHDEVDKSLPQSSLMNAILINNDPPTLSQADISGLTTTSYPVFAGLTLTSPLSIASGGTGNTDGRATINANLTGPITSVGNATSVASQTGTGSTFVMQASPSLTTPNIGDATATTINKIAFTAPASTATFTLANGKTFTVSNTLTLAGTDGTTMTFPSTSATIARTDSGQTFTGNQSVNGQLSVSAASASAIVQLSRTSTSAGSGWIGADSSYSFRVFDAAFADRFRVAQNATVTDITSAGVVSSNMIAGSATSTAAAGQLAIGTTTASTVGAAGAATALPANPLGYLVMNLGGSNIKIPYYNN